MNPVRSEITKRSLACIAAGLMLLAGSQANAQVTWSIGIDAPTYYEPAPVYRAPPPVYYQPAPHGYYQPAPPVYVQPPPPVYYPSAPPRYQERYYGEQNAWHRGREVPEPRLSDMQQRAYDNCSMLARRDQPRCRATVMSTVR